MKPATRVNEFTLDIIEFCENDPYLYKELNKEREKRRRTLQKIYLFYRFIIPGSKIYLSR